MTFSRYDQWLEAPYDREDDRENEGPDPDSARDRKIDQELEELPPPRFKPGDRVYITDAAGRTQWIVARLDYWRADHEQAYRLTTERGYRERYAHESVLVPAEPEQDDHA